MLRRRAHSDEGNNLISAGKADEQGNKASFEDTNLRLFTPLGSYTSFMSFI